MSAPVSVRSAPGSAHVLAYGALGLPLAFAALPIYVQVPKLYADSLGLPLAAVGLTLLVVRIFDGLTDPLIGWASDRWWSRPRWVLSALPILALGMVALLAPPEGGGLPWLAAALVLVTLAWSVASIAYYAWGAEISADTHVRTRAVASREGFALLGVMLAAGLPGVLSEEEATGLSRLVWVFAVLLVVCGSWTLAGASPPVKTGARDGGQGPWRDLLAALDVPVFRRLLLVFCANGIAAAIPSVTVLFFVADVLRAERLAGGFLLMYFAAAALSLPAWVLIARRCGKRRTWCAAMLLAMVSFLWAGFLGAGDVLAFALICAASGIAFGADLALPPAMLADLLARCARGQGGGDDSRAGAWFGWWNFVSKANLALAAGLALPMLGLLGYTPGVQEAQPLAALSAVYASLPLLMKLLALLLLLNWRKELET